MKIEIKHLKKAYTEVTPLEDVNAVINDGDVIAIIGPSGCGKSTLIRCINMIDPPTSGQILVDGENITDERCDLSKIRQKIGMVFQSYNLFEHLTIVENVMLALTDIKHLSRQQAYDIAVAELTKVGLADKLLSYPDQLSGGQKQRASIARTLAVDPEVILLDEPTSALDPTMVREVETVIKNLAKTGKTMMIVTHEMRLARAISNRVFFLDKGGVYEDGTPEQVFDNPQRERTKAFINHLKVFKYKFRVSDFDYTEYLRMLNDFVSNNFISPERIRPAQSILSWFAMEFIPKYMEDNILCNIITEYGEDENIIKILLYVSTNEQKKDAMKHDLADTLLQYDSNALVSEIRDEDFDLKVSCSL